MNKKYLKWAAPTLDGLSVCGSNTASISLWPSSCLNWVRYALTESVKSNQTHQYTPAPHTALYNPCKQNNHCAAAALCLSITQTLLNLRLWFSLLSIILADISENRSSLQRVQKVTSMAGDWKMSFIFKFFSGSLGCHCNNMIDNSENH